MNDRDPRKRGRPSGTSGPNGVPLPSTPDARQNGAAQPQSSPSPQISGKMFTWINVYMDHGLIIYQ